MSYIKDKKQQSKYIIMIFSISLCFYLLSPVMTPTDSKYNSHTAYSIIVNGDSTLDEFDIDENDYRVQRVGNHTYNYFPMWTSLFLIPAVSIGDGIIGPAFEFFPEFEELIRRLADDKVYLSHPIKIYELYPINELITSSLICALSIVIFFKISLRHLPIKSSLIVALIFAFSTPMWSTVSRALWMHSPSILMLLSAIYCLDRGQNDKKLIPLTAIPIAIAFMIRPTNAISAVLFTLYILIYHRDSFNKYILYASPFAALYVIYNYLTYEQLFSTYSDINRLSLHQEYFNAIAGNLFSPSRGILVYCPFFILSFWGLLKSSGVNKRLGILFFNIIILHLLVISSYWHWWGGHSFGPRLFSDMLPFLGFGLILALQDISSYKKSIYIFLGITATAAFFIHANGALNYNAYHWNNIPRDVDLSPSRIWDWKDPQFLRLTQP